MNWSRTSIIAAGVGLILLTDAVALGSVAYNRSGEPDSVLQLTGRELRLPLDWVFNRENSGLSVTLHCRTLGKNNEPEMDIGTDHGAIGYGAEGSPKWLDEAKLIALGFDAPPRRHASTDMSMDALLPREVLLVLEYDGPAYRRALEKAREDAARAEAMQLAYPGNKEMERRASLAKENLAREENSSSRLFIVDAGLDGARLRSAYPDRSRYAIVRGKMQAHWIKTGNGMPRLIGHIAGIHADSINVPLAFRSHFALKAAPMSKNKLIFKLEELEDLSRHAAPREITVAFGRRFEPWIVAAASR